MEGQFDLYGFKLSIRVQQASDKIECDKLAEACEKQWKPCLEKNKLPNESKLKDLARKGIPPTCRTWVWMETSGASAKKARHPASYYQNMVIAGSTSPSLKDIEQDLGSTLKNHPWLQTSDAKQALRRVLSAFSVHNSKFGYCRSMHHVVALLLMAMNRNEENTFWILTALVEDILYPGTYSLNLEGCHDGQPLMQLVQVEMKALEEMLRHKLPRLHQHLAALQCDMTLIATEWYLCLYTTSLPSETVARVWDALFNEGPKILFRVALAILKMHEEVLLRADNTGELLMVIRKAAQDLHHRDNLMDVAFHGIGSMPMAEIEALREQKVRDVENMLKEREALKRRQDLKEVIEVKRKEQEDALDAELEPPSTPSKVEAMSAAAVTKVQEGFGKMVVSVKASATRLGSLLQKPGTHPSGPEPPK